MRQVSRQVSRSGSGISRFRRIIPRSKKMRLLAAVVIVIAAAGGFWVLRGGLDKSSQTRADGTANSTSSASGQVAPAGQFDKARHSINDPGSLWVVINKGRVLPKGYVPSDLVVPGVPLRTNASGLEMHLRSAAAKALERMAGEAKNQGIGLMLASGYRSYNLQSGLYSGYTKSLGKAEADRSSARPGHSEHQSGLAADVEPTNRKCELQQCFETTPEGAWLIANAHKHGFIIRYPKTGESLTGYEYEPWHIRYVGEDLAAQIHNSGQVLEQFFGLPIYADYPAQSYQLGPGL